jgi:hypothetical protein
MTDGGALVEEVFAAVVHDTRETFAPALGPGVAAVSDRA